MFGKKIRMMSIVSIAIVSLMASMVAGAAEYKEAPALAEMVKAGSLAPVAERMPENPLVVQPNQEIGQYGGTWRSGLRGGGDNAWLVRTIAYQHLMRWDVNYTKPIPNVAESVAANDDSTEFTFSLRKGLKWSDGAPFTADDIMYVYEILMNTELTPNFPGFLQSGGEKGTVEKIDAYTVVFKFAASNGLFLQRMATPDGWQWVSWPKHVVSQYDAKQNPDAEKMAKELGFETSQALMQNVIGWDGRFHYAFPTLGAWYLTAPYKGDTTVLVAERNPYFWKVDPEGQQLPYIDKVVYSVGSDTEALVLKGIAGELDMQDRHIAIDANKAVFFDSQEQGGFRFFATIPASMNTCTIQLNQTNTDPVKREIFQNKNFRIGLSHAIDRQEIIDVVYVGQGEPFQAAPRPSSALYNERLAKQYTEYDPDLANEYLDKAGYTERDADGFRLGPDGKRISFSIESTTVATDRNDILEIVRGYWEEVGIEMTPKIEDRSIMYARKDNNEHDGLVWGGDGGLDVILEPRYYFPYSGESAYAEAWQAWFNKAATPAPEEPTAGPKKQMELYNQIKATADSDAQMDLMKQILEISADEFYIIGISLPSEGYGIVNKKMRNVQDPMINAWLYPHPGPTNPEQYFYVK